MRTVLILILSVFSYHLSSQALYFGRLEKEYTYRPGDVIIFEQIHWEESQTQFSLIGLRQVKRLDSLLASLKEFKITIEVHSFTFFGDKSSRVDEKISKVIADKLAYLLVKSKHEEVDITFECLGNTKPLSESDRYSRFMLEQLNSRIEIKIK